jgi:hypothetical protein
MNDRKSIRFTLVGGFLSLIVLSLSIQSSTQSQNPSQEDSQIKHDDQLIICRAFLAVVRVDVIDQEGKEITDLTKDDLIIYEDGVKQELYYWKRNVGPNKKPDQSMYEAGYLPNHRHFRGEWRKIRVVVRNQEERKLGVQFAPNGYYAKKELLL